MPDTPAARGALAPALPAPSAEVRAEALARAERLAAGLFPHQVDGVAFLLGRRRAILADDMGLGKTRQSIVAMTEAAPDGPWLVVSPASVKRNWAREILAARPDAAVHVVGPDAPPAAGWTGWVVVNYDLLAKHLMALGRLPWAGLVFDEAHYLKNHTSQRATLASRLVAGVPDAVVHALTGTPLTNRPRDLFPLLQLVGHPMGRSFLPFAKRYCAAHHNGFGWVTDGASNLAELRVQLQGVMLRRTKDEVLDLPPKLRRWVPVPVPAHTARREMRRVVERLVASALERGARREVSAEAVDEVAATPARRRAARGRAAAPGFQDRVRLLADLTKARHALAVAKVATTAEYVEGVVAQGEKAIVFSAFDEPVQRLAERFGDAAVVLTGATRAAQRQALVDRFQQDDGVRVFVANLVAGGVGLTLTAARQVVFNDLDWVPANHWQAEDRAYRIGQTGSVQVTYFVATDTVDEFVSAALSAKAALVDVVVEGVGAAPEGAGLTGDLLGDLERLVAQLSPGIATLDDAASGEDPVDRLLREVTAAVAARSDARGVARDVGDAEPRAPRALPAEAILALARVLAGPASRRWRLASTSGRGHYVLDADGGDVTCTCRGFEYRGQCRHARALQAALAAGREAPAGYEVVAGSP